MSTNWPYAILAKEAAAHGGPQAFLAATRRVGFCEGVVTCIVIGATHYIFDRYVYRPLYEKQLKADSILADEKLEFKRIINDDSDIDRIVSIGEDELSRILSDDDDENKAEREALLKEQEGTLEEMSSDLDELKKRLRELEGEDEWPEERSVEDDILSFLASIELSTEDMPLMRIAMDHPAYKSFARNYRKYQPEADVFKIVSAFARTMAPVEEEEDSDELQS